MSDDKPIPQRNDKGQFKVGHSGHPGGGRPKGSRAKLGEAFIQDMYEAWQRVGPDVINHVASTDPASLLRSMVAILPKEVDVNVNKYDSMNDAQLRAQFLAALRDARALGIDLSVGDAADADQALPTQPPGPLPPIH